MATYKMGVTKSSNIGQLKLLNFATLKMNKHDEKGKIDQKNKNTARYLYNYAPSILDTFLMWEK